MPERMKIMNKCDLISRNTWDKPRNRCWLNDGLNMGFRKCHW